MVIAVVVAGAVIASGCGDSVQGSEQPELAAALEDKWAPILAANKIGKVDFNGHRLRVEYGVSAAVETPVEASDVPNYADDPMAFTVVVHRTPAGPQLDFFGDFEEPRYRFHRVKHDVDDLLHRAMTAYLRKLKILEGPA